MSREEKAWIVVSPEGRVTDIGTVTALRYYTREEPSWLQALIAGGYSFIWMPIEEAKLKLDQDVTVNIEEG